MNSRRIRQNITYHCRNSHAVKNDKGVDTAFIKLRGDHSDLSINSHPRVRPTILTDGCNVKDNKWHKTVLQVDIDSSERLPLKDIAVFDVADENEEFGIELGPVCFS